LSLPDIEKGQSVDDFDLSTEEKYLIGFCINQGSAAPKKTAQDYSKWTKFNKKQIANNLFKIRHWEIIKSSYESIANEKATWFIDPPYQFGGEWYTKNNKSIDYNKLSQWCKSRKGQSIVCENIKADWMPFKPMKDVMGIKYRTTEAIWSNLPTQWDAVQYSMFESERV